MKKIIFIFMLIPIMSVNAKTYYTDYYLIEENSTQLKKESSTLKREEVRVYNTYETEIKELGYQDDNCANYEKDNYIEEEIITKEKVNNTSKLYQSFLYQDIFLHAFMIRGIKKDIELNEIKIKSGEEEIPYVLVDATVSNKENINDNDINTKVIVTSKDSFTIQTKELVNVNNLTIEFISDDSFESNIIFILKDTKINYIQSLINTNIIDFKSEDKITEIINVAGYFENTEVIKSYYKSKIKKYMCYEEILKPLNIYVLSGDNIDKDDYEIRYNYYKRDYIKVSDKKLTKKCSLKSLILDTSLDVDDLEINSNIDFDKTGNYEIEYRFKDKIFSHKIKYEKLENKNTEKITTTKVKGSNGCICKNNNKYIYYFRISIVIILILVLIIIKQKLRNN